MRACGWACRSGAALAVSGATLTAFAARPGLDPMVPDGEGWPVQISMSGWAVLRGCGATRPPRQGDTADHQDASDDGPDDLPAHEAARNKSQSLANPHEAGHDQHGSDQVANGGQFRAILGVHQVGKAIGNCLDASGRQLNARRLLPACKQTHTERSAAGVVNGHPAPRSGRHSRWQGP